MILIGLGANLPHPELGPPRHTLAAALARLRERGVRVAACSRWYATRPYPAALADQPWFVNGVARIETALDPAALLALMHEVEWALGRVRQRKWEPRIVDLDLIAYHDRVLAGDGGGPVVPHPRLAERGFVLIPLRDVAPGWRHPVTGLGLDRMIAGLGPEQAVSLHRAPEPAPSRASGG